MNFEFLLLNPVYVFTQSLPEGITPLGSFEEAVGSSYIIQKVDAEAAGIAATFPCRCIQLKTPTSLTSVGITAQISGVLSQASIPCNVVAAYAHDYFFVPEKQALAALTLLKAQPWKA